MTAGGDLERLIAELRGRGEPFALATVVRTVRATAAKAGAKAVITATGGLAGGWIGGGCARAAVVRAARIAIAEGKPRLVSVRPPEELPGTGEAGEDGSVTYATNMCPSRGTMDVFVEPVLPPPQLVLFGTGPVAAGVAELARRYGFEVAAPDTAAARGRLAADRWIAAGETLPAGRERFVLVATQGSGDSPALERALAMEAVWYGFVGSRAKFAHLRAGLAAAGVPEDLLGRVESPAGLDIGAIGPEEIALSIVARLVEVRRRRQRAAADRS